MFTYTPQKLTAGTPKKLMGLSKVSHISPFSAGWVFSDEWRSHPSNGRTHPTPHYHDDPSQSDKEDMSWWSTCTAVGEFFTWCCPLVLFWLGKKKTGELIFVAFDRGLAKLETTLIRDVLIFLNWLKKKHLKSTPSNWRCWLFEVEIVLGYLKLLRGLWSIWSA